MFDDEQRMIETAEKAISGNLSVRQIEKLAKQPETSQKSVRPSKNSDSYFTEMEISLREHLGRKVKVDYGKNKGVLILEFYDKDDLSSIADKLVDDMK